MNCGVTNAFYGMHHTIQAVKKLKKASKAYTKKSTFRATMSLISRGKNNPMYNRNFYQVWLEKFGQKEADARMAKRRAKISSLTAGERNPMYGKPSPTGSGNGWSGWYKKWYFRSLKELSYVVGLEKDGISWKSAGGIKIKYKDAFGTNRTYTPDFVVGHKVVEVKPAKLKSSILVRLKEAAAKEYCAAHSMQYEIIDPKTLSEKEILKLHNTGKIKFLPRYQEKFNERYKNKTKP